MPLVPTIIRCCAHIVRLVCGQMDATTDGWTYVVSQASRIFPRVRMRVVITARMRTRGKIRLACETRMDGGRTVYTAVRYGTVRGTDGHTANQLSLRMRAEG